VFAALAHFVAAGNSLVILRGNHDVDWHWEATQRELVHCLAGHAPIGDGSVEFLPWFYYEEGLVYVEHGHQYDAFCSYDHVLWPVSPRDPRRTALSLSDVLLRYVVKPTRGMLESGHDRAGLFDYVRFALRLGRRGTLKLASRFIAAVQALIGLWREHWSDALGHVRREHERRMQLLAEARAIGIERLRALAKLQRPPITRSLFGLLAGVMLDRVLLAAAALVFGALFALLAPQLGLGLSALALGLGAIVLFVLARAWRKLRDSLEPSAELRERSARVARLFPAAFVVMGHTHLPEVRATAESATYVNLGSWAEEEHADGRTALLPATRTHLVVAQGEQPVAELLTWSSEGPRPFGRERV
jgi:hypothetical protein